MVLAITASVGSILASNFTAGNILSLVVLKLGAQAGFLGILSFASLAPGFFCLFTLSLVDKMAKKRLLFPGYFLSAVFAVPLLFLPFTAAVWPLWANLALITVSILLRNASTGLSSAGWFPLLQDIVPTRYVGRFFARLRTSWQSASLLSLIASAVIIGDDPTWMRFEILFVLGLISELFKSLPVLGITERPMESNNGPGSSIPASIIEFIRFGPLGRYNIYVFLIAFASNAVEPFKVAMLSDLGYSAGFILAATAMVGTGAVISLGLWGKIADRYGNRAIFSITPLGMILTTIGWLFVGKSGILGMIYVMLLYLAFSIFSSGNGIAQTNYMLRAVPKNKQNFLTLILLVQRIGLAVSPLVSAAFLSNAQRLNLFNERFRYDILFVFTSLVLAGSYLIRKSLKAQTDMPTNQVVFIMAKPLYDIIYPAVRLFTRAGRSDETTEGR